MFTKIFYSYQVNCNVEITNYKLEEILLLKSKSKSKYYKDMCNYGAKKVTNDCFVDVILLLYNEICSLIHAINFNSFYI